MFMRPSKVLKSSDRWDILRDELTFTWEETAGRWRNWSICGSWCWNLWACRRFWPKSVSRPARSPPSYCRGESSGCFELFWPFSWLLQLEDTENKTGRDSSKLFESNDPTTQQQSAEDLVKPRPVSCRSWGRPLFQRGWAWGTSGYTSAVCAGERSGWVWSSRLLLGVNPWWAACGAAEQPCPGWRSPPGGGRGFALPPVGSANSQVFKKIITNWVKLNP